MPVQSYEVFAEQWDQIVANLKKEANWGATGPGTGTNSTGRLQTVKSITEGDYPDFGHLPWIGVMFIRAKETPYATQRRHKVISEFKISVAAGVTGTGDTFVMVDQALLACRKLLSDGAGNGVLPVLRDSANYTLNPGTGATCDYTLTPEYTMSWARAPGKGSLYVAVSEITLEAAYWIQPSS